MLVYVDDSVNVRYINPSRKTNRDKTRQANKEQFEMKSPDWKLRVENKSTFTSWSSMIGRCSYPSNDDFHRYGARGIRVCEQWLTFANFLADMGARPEGHTIERKDVHGNYEPNNCTWATRTEQARNRSSNRVLELNGVSMSMAAWAEHMGMKQTTLLKRLRTGWPVEKALKTPVLSKNH